MLPANDHVESFINSIRFAKHALSPLESGIKKAAKDFENFWFGTINGATSLQVVRGEVDVYGNTNCSVDQICSLRKINGQCMAGDERKKGLSIKLTMKTLLEMIPQNINNGDKSVLLESGRKETNAFQEDGTCLNCLQLPKMRQESNGKDEEVNNMLSKWLVGFMFDQLTQDLQQKSESNTGDSAMFPPRINRFDHLKAVTNILEGKRADIGGFLRNLKFAKVGGFHSSAIVVTSPPKEEDSYDGFNTEIGGSSPQKNARNNKFGAATALKPAGSVLKSALAGGLSCAFSTALMHPIDTIKTHVQASTLSFPEIVSKIPEIGARGLYKGSTPAILGQFLGHGFRTGFFEASKIVLINVAPSLANRQAESVLSFCSAVLGTVARVPSEVVKQRLQAGVFDHLGEAIIGTWQQEGFKGFFRGTGATLCREVPFYVAGLGFYTESKKAVQRIIGRELEPWETVAVGAITGGLTAVSTTPFDVIKTRMMISTQGRPVSMYMVAFSILAQDGPLGLFKGAVPRFFWVAPLGAINFAGYELARKAMG